MNFSLVKYKITFMLGVIITSLFMFGFKSEDRIYENIYIQNINLEDMNKSDALKKLNEKYSPQNIDINYNDKTWTITPDDINLSYNLEESINKAMNYTDTDSKLLNIKRKYNLRFKEPYKILLEATYDEIKLSNIINNISASINKDEIEATIKINDDGSMIKTSSKEGISVDVIKLKEEIYESISNIEKKVLKLPINILYPKVTTKDVDSIDCVLGQYTTSFNNKTSRGNNIIISAKDSSDVFLNRDEIFSYNKTTGARTWSKGYKTAKVIVGGKYINGEGGGVCQVSSNIYNAVLLSGLEIKEVHNHTFQSRYVPRGRDSAVSYGYIDLKFKNNNNNPIYIKNIAKNNNVTTKIYGSKEDKKRVYIKTKEEYQKDKIITKTYRVYLDKENQKIDEELISTSTYKRK